MFELTQAQHRAVETVDRSVVVPAAAGAGKTAVLAERCAHLVCDLPADKRCRVDELLVVTFTEAAAAEMKARVLAAIRRRAAERPGDVHIRTQAALVETAQISTIHAFCRWMLLRWFHEASIDPAARVLDADEAELLRRETVHELFEACYEADTELGRGFLSLAEDYYQGKDAGLADLVLRLSAFLRSLPDPQTWMDSAVRAYTDHAEETAIAFESRLREEVRLVRDHACALADYAGAHLADGAGPYLDALRHYVDSLDEFAHIADYDTLRLAIAEFKYRVASKKKPTDPDTLAQRDQATAMYKGLRKMVAEGRMRKWSRFSRAELVDGLRQARPYVASLVDLVRAFDDRFAAAKRRMDALDFSDLEQGAFALLRDAGGVVARSLRQRFAHVLVDEVQDVNPLQDAILQRVSRASEPAQAGNLFRVGDIKQSIYRFRLAEPNLFRVAVDHAVESDDTGAATSDESTTACIRLQKNFRSRPAIIDGVNFVFERLMSRAIGGVDYDRREQLHAGVELPDGEIRQPIELHIVERDVQPAAPGNDDNDTDMSDADEAARAIGSDDPAQWKSIEREAYVIGRRIREIREAGMQVGDRPLRWGDVAVLLRSATHTAGPLAEQLTRMGVPAVTETGSSLLEAMEVRDVLSLLQVLDNPRQDIPLASVLRSGVTGYRIDEDGLLAIRHSDRSSPFHETVLAYAEHGDDPRVRATLRRMFERIDRWRAAIRREPIADVLWRVYGESGYLAYVGGLRGGKRRRANLLALHDRARQFAGFARQGLHRFLDYLEAVRDENRPMRAAPPPENAQDAVRVMTVHASKGLEFPVVFIADLARKFNLQDARGNVILERHVGIGMRVVDRERMIAFPTAQHLAAKASIETAARDEELRVLYVAMTRAKQKLVLVATDKMQSHDDALHDDALQDNASLNGASDDADARWHVEASGPLTRVAIASAQCPLDWIRGVLGDAPPEALRRVDDATTGETPLFELHEHPASRIRLWQNDDDSEESKEQRAMLRSVAARKALPPGEPRLPEFDARDLLDRLDYAYPHLSSCSVRAVIGASEAKRFSDPFEDEHQPARVVQSAENLPRPIVLSSPTPGKSTVSPQERGTITHRLFEHLRFGAAVPDELHRLVAEGVLSQQELAAAHVDGVHWFTNTALAGRIAAAGDAYRREFMFISAEPAELFDATIGKTDENVLVRGVVDGVLPTDDGIEVVDFKTDDISAGRIADRTEGYRLQMRLYSRALTRVFGKPVTRAWLVFLTPRRLVEIGAEQLV